MTPQELKSSILQLAVQGKLVEQRPEEGTAEELYWQIQEEKQRLIEEGKLKKEKPLPKITEDEIPFDIPESWKWVRLNEISLMIGDIDHKMPETVVGDGIPYISPLNFIDNEEIDFDNAKKISKTDYEALSKKCKPDKNDIIFPRYGTIGVVRYIKTDIPFLVSYSCCTIKNLSLEYSYPKFIYYVLKSNLIKNEIKRYVNKTTQPNVGLQSIKMFLFPLPPLAEQKRIVAKIEELLPYIDRYEKAWSRLEELNKRFPDDMQKSVLQMAIQGKLVEQRPEEGTAEELYQQIQEEKQRLIEEGKIKKEKPLPEIKEDEIPFDIPESWMWVRLREVGITQTGNTPSKTHPEYFGHDVPFITPGDILNSKINYQNQGVSSLGESFARICPVNSILQVCIGGSIGKAAITSMKVAFNQQINSLTPIKCSSQFLFAIFQSAYFISNMKEKAGGTATPIINRGIWDSLLIPLPPLAEQKRIVEKLEEILPLCENLK